MFISTRLAKEIRKLFTLALCVWVSYDVTNVWLVLSTTLCCGKSLAFIRSKNRHFTVCTLQNWTGRC